MRTLIISACLVVVGCTALAQAPDARIAPPVVIRKTVQTTDGKTLEGRVLNGGMSDLQLRTDDQKVHLLRKTAGDRYRAVTSQRDWPTYHGDPGGNRYTTLTQIDKSNVAELKVTWEYHTGDVSDGGDGRRKSAFEATPIVAEGTMYLSTPFNRVVALDPETGREKWSFDPKIDLNAPYSEGLINRGVTLWTDPGRAEGDVAAGESFWRQSMRASSHSMP